MKNVPPSDAHRRIFSFHKLSVHGKEYWFLLFTSDDTKKARQLMITFGDQNVKSYAVDSCRISENYSFKGKHVGPSSYWFYDKKIHRSKTMPSSIDVKESSIFVASPKSEILLTGEYPKYNLVLKKEGKKICDLKTRKGSDYAEYEIIDYFKSGLGAGYVNLLLDFEGKLNGSRFSGHGYIQKVVSTAPLPGIPWYWGRIYFSKNYILDFLQPHVSVSKLDKEFTVYAYFYDSKKNKKYFFEDIKVRKFGKRNKYFLILGKSKGKEFTVILKSYAQKNFRLDSIGTMDYEQNLVKVAFFSLESGNKLITMKDTGEGIGILEDAYGYIL